MSSTTVKAFLYLPCSDRSMCGYFHSASRRHLLFLSRTFQTLFFSSLPYCRCRCNFLWSFFANTDCNKCGQTSGPEDGNTIQTGGNFEEGTDSCCCFLASLHFNFINFIVSYNPRVAASVAIMVVILCIVISTFCYSKIFLALHHRQTQVQGHGNPGQTHGGGIYILGLLMAKSYKKNILEEHFS